MIRYILAIILSAALSGCGSLPLVSGQRVRMRHTDPFGSVTVEAHDVKVTADAVTAAKYRRTVSYPSFTSEIEVDDYARLRQKP